MLFYSLSIHYTFFFFFFQAEDGIRDYKVTGVQTCALPILRSVATPDAFLGHEIHSMPAGASACASAANRPSSSRFSRVKNWTKSIAVRAFDFRVTDGSLPSVRS